MNESSYEEYKKIYFMTKTNVMVLKSYAYIRKDANLNSQSDKIAVVSLIFPLLRFYNALWEIKYKGKFKGKITCDKFNVFKSKQIF